MQTQKTCGQLIVADYRYDIFLRLILYPTFNWGEPSYHLERGYEGWCFAELVTEVVSTEVVEPWSRGKWKLEVFRSINPKHEEWNGKM